MWAPIPSLLAFEFFSLNPNNTAGRICAGHSVRTWMAWFCNVNSRSSFRATPSRKQKTDRQREQILNLYPVSQQYEPIHNTNYLHKSNQFTVIYWVCSITSHAVCNIKQFKHPYEHIYGCFFGYDAISTAHYIILRYIASNCAIDTFAALISYDVIHTILWRYTHDREALIWHNAQCSLRAKQGQA